MNIFFFCILLIASCRTESLPNDANGATQANDNPMVDAATVDLEGSAIVDSGDAVQEESICDIEDEKSFFDKLTITKKSGSGKHNDPFVLECTKDEKHTSFEIYCDKSLGIVQKSDSDDDFVVTKDELESKCDLPNNLAYLRENLIPLRRLETSITGIGQPKDPFVVKCKKGFTLFFYNKGYSDRFLLIRDKSKAGTWKVSYYPSEGGFFSPYSEINIRKLTKIDELEKFTCSDNSYIFSFWLLNYIKLKFIPNRNFDPEDITGTGRIKDPFVVKCVENYTLPNLHHYNTIQLGILLSEGDWSFLDFTLDKTNSKRIYSSRLIVKKKDDRTPPDEFTCQPEKNKTLQKCDLTSIQNSKKLTTYGMQQIPSLADTKFHVSCVENTEEIAVYCKSTNTIVEKNKDGDDSPIDTKEMERRCNVFSNIDYLKFHFTPGRNLDPDKITGSGQPKNPFVLKCLQDKTLPEMNHYNTIQLLLEDNDFDNEWSLLDFTFDKTNSKRYSTVEIGPKKDDVEADKFTCEDEPDGNNALQKCDLTSFQNSKLTTYGMQQIPNTADTHVSCVENNEEFTVYCKSTNTIFEKITGGEDSPIDAKEMEKRCDLITNLKSLKENLIPNRNLDPEDINGTGVTNDPFVVKCITGHYLNNKNNFDRLLLIHNEDNWQLLNFTVDKSNELRKLKITFDKTDSYNESDFLSCKSSATKPIQKCKLFVDPKIQTFGMKQIPYQPNTNFYLSCAQYDAEFAVYCKNDTKIYDKITDVEITAEEINKRCFDVQYLIDTLTQTDRNLQDELTGSGKPDDPFIVKCKRGFSIYNKKHVDMIVFFTGKIKTWKISNYYSDPKTEKRYSEMNNVELRNALNCTTIDLSTPLCDITSFKNNQKLNTYGITTLKNKDNNVFYVSCAKNSQEFGISCKDNEKLMDTRYGLTETEISSEEIEKRCNICPLKDLWQKIIPMNMILSPSEAEKYLLKCRVNYAKIADKRDLEAKCSDEGEWEVYQLDTGIKVEFDNVYCEREGCNGYKLLGKSSYNESIVMSYTLAVDLNNDDIEELIELIHIE